MLNNVNNSGYSQEHRNILIAPNGRSGPGAEGEGCRSAIGAFNNSNYDNNMSDSAQAPTFAEDLSNGDLGMLIHKIICFLENCESLIGIPMIMDLSKKLIFWLRKIYNILSALGFCHGNSDQLMI